MPLESLTIKRFQKHKNRTIKFDPFATTIVGPTDSGKSSIIRALRFVSLNQLPKGRYFRFGSKSCSVVLTLDGKKVTRRKGKRNTYQISKGKPFKAVGTKVPEKVANLINLGSVNFQRQLDLPFWFTSTPGQVSRNLNEIVNLGVIDSSLSNIATMLRKARSELEVAEQRLKEAKGRKKSTAWIVQFNRDLTDLETLENREIKLRNSLVKLDAQTRVVSNYYSRYRKAKLTRLCGEELIVAAQKLLTLQNEIEDLGQIVKELEKEDHVDSKMFGDFARLERYRAYGDKYADDLRNLESAVREVTLFEEELCQAKQEVVRSEKTLKKKTKGICPLCGTKTNQLLSSSRIYTSGTCRRSRVLRRAVGGTKSWTDI